MGYYNYTEQYDILRNEHFCLSAFLVLCNMPNKKVENNLNQYYSSSIVTILLVFIIIIIVTFNLHLCPICFMMLQ